MIQLKKALTRRNRAGFTLMEVMVASIISVIVIGGVTVALIDGLKIWQQEEIKNELNINLEIAMEKIKQDLRLSSIGIGLMSFYPTNAAQYTAISMPLSADVNNDGLLDRDASTGKISWNRTVVYHIRPGTPDTLLRTEFSPRYTNATTGDIYSQLSNVVASTSDAGLAAACLPGESVSSRVVFQNLVSLKFTPPDANVDCYWPTVAKGSTFNWGSIVLGSGTHQLTLTVAGKNASSTGYRVEVDRIVMSSSGSKREGEIFLPINTHPETSFFNVTSVGGPCVAIEQGQTWSWSGNCALSCVAAGIGSTLTFDIYNDLWTDSNFNDPGGVMCSNCSMKIDTSFRSQDPFVQEVVISPDTGTVWTSSSGGSIATNPVYYQTLTIITNMIYGGTNNLISRSGCWAKFEFSRGAACSLLVTNAAVRDVDTGISADITFNAGQRGVIIPIDGSVTTNSDWVQMYEIDKGRVYEVKFETAELYGDRDYDLFVGESGANAIRFFQNTGTEFVPSFSGFVPNWQGISASGAIAPAFGDLDGDGDYDLVIGVVGGSPYRFYYYRNDGTIKSPNMVPVDNGVPDNNSANPTPYLADINGDGKLDFINGFMDGYFYLYLNTGSTTNPQWSLVTVGTDSKLKDCAGSIMDVGSYSSPVLVDIDGNGTLDLFSGCDSSTLWFWQNIGTPTNFSFQYVTNAYGGLTNASTRCIPRFVDIDADGTVDLYVGSLDGRLTYYHNTGTVANAAWAPAVSLGVVAAGGRAAPAFCNIDQDRNGAACWTNDTMGGLSYVNGTPTKATLGLSTMATGYAKESLYLSGVFDTRMTAPAYNQLRWTHVENTARGWDVDVRMRASAYRNMGDLLEDDWLTANPANNGYFESNTGNPLPASAALRKKYVQYEVRFKCNETGAFPGEHTNSTCGAVLRDVTIDWPGQTGLVDLLVDFGKGPDCGIVSAKVDGQTFVKGIQVEMSIFKAGRTGTQSASGTLEIRPLNTGK